VLPRTSPRCPGLSQEEGKVFFFEKKNQKTFANASGFRFKAEARMLPAMTKSFFGSFFQK
jgi:hypothetical protein